MKNQDVDQKTNHPEQDGSLGSSLRPLVYSQLMDVRFSDLDPYGHVSTGRYLDIVIASRYIFFANYFKTPIDELAKNDLGFYTSRLEEVNFLRSITGVHQVLVESYSTILEPGRHRVTFTIKSVSDSKVFVQGSYIDHPVKLSTKKPQPLPPWAHKYIFEE